jgi:hypothetical protein
MGLDEMKSQNLSKGDSKYVVKEHSSSVLTSVKKLQVNSELCDVVLAVGPQEIRAHRVILAANSPYFEAMFTGPLLESQQRRILLPNVSENAAKSLVEFMYTSQITITEDSVGDLLTLAAMWQIDPVVSACGEFMSGRITTDNCLELLTIAVDYNCKNLSDVAYKFAEEHFLEVCQSEAFVLLQVGVMCSLLKSEDLKIRSESDVLDLVLKWYKHDVNLRQDDVLLLLQNTRLPLVPWEELNKKFESQELFSSHPECATMVTNARNYQLHPEVVADYNLEDIQYIPRRSVSQSSVIYVVGGEVYPARSTVSTVEQFNPISGQWKELSPMASPRRGMGVCMCDGLLYVVGGSDGLQALCLVECFDLTTNIWKRVCNLLEERSSVGAGVVDGQLYAVGGYDGVSSCLTSVERYNSETDQWSLVSPMNIARSMMAVATFQTKMFAIGGYDGHSDLSSCEMYNTYSNQWTVVASMNVPRCMPGVCVISQVLHVVGGCDQSQSLNSAELYHIDTDTWRMTASMHKPRSGLGVAAVGNKVYALGGYTGSDYCRSIECYDPKEGKWLPMSRMKMGKRRFGCCS